MSGSAAASAAVVMGQVRVGGSRLTNDEVVDSINRKKIVEILKETWSKGMFWLLLLTCVEKMIKLGRKKETNIKLSLKLSSKQTILVHERRSGISLIC